MSQTKVLFPERFKNPARFYTTGRPTYPKLLAMNEYALTSTSRPSLDRRSFAHKAGTGAFVDPSDAIS